MAVISDTSDGDNGGDPNKKPQEEEEVEVKKSFAQTPVGITEHCFAITRRCHYPKLSLASTEFRRIISSPKLYEKRSSLGVTEPVLYASIGFPPSELPSWYILHRNHDGESLRLRRLDSIPGARWGSAVVTIGPMMYEIGGSDGQNPTKDVTLIDCRFHTYESLPRMKRARSLAAAGVIDGKIYVIGGCEKVVSWNWVEVFDVKNKVWSEVSIPFPLANWSGQFVTCAVMDEKIYVWEPFTCFVFDPKVGELVLWDDGRVMSVFWQVSSCVVDDLLYTIHIGRFCTSIYFYDPKAKEKRWRPVCDVRLRSLPPFISYYDSKMANLGGRLVILVGNSPWFSFSPHGVEEIWCIEISLERREKEGGDFEMWMNWEPMTRVHTSLKWPSIELSRTVTV